MKTIKLVFFAVVAFLMLISATVADQANVLDNQLNALKQELKDLIKPARFEGSRVTYYKITKKPQFKNVEIFLLMESEYIFAFSGKVSSVPVHLRFYDSMDESERTLIYEVKNINEKNITVSSKDLNAAYRKKVPEVERLKRVFVEYEITKGSEKNEGVVMVIGNK